MTRFTLQAGHAQATISPEEGGRLTSLEIAGLELLVGPRRDPMTWGCFPMAPWAGRVRRGVLEFAGREHHLPLDLPPHAIHGTVYRSPWKHEGGGRLRAPLGPEWPFGGYAVQEFELHESGLEIELQVHAEASPFPANLGWHPWFHRQLVRGGPCELAFRARSMFEHDDEMIPNGNLVAPPARPWDNCFGDVIEEPTLTWPHALKLELRSSAPYWVVYDEPEETICLEPLTGPPNAINDAPQIVNPGKPLAIRMGLSWELL